MASFVTAVQFLVGVYWPFMAAAAAVGLVTGWLSLGTGRGEGKS